jgi:hypothetical protein
MAYVLPTIPPHNSGLLVADRHEAIVKRDSHRALAEMRRLCKLTTQDSDATILARCSRISDAYFTHTFLAQELQELREERELREREARQPVLLRPLA